MTAAQGADWDSTQPMQDCPKCHKIHHLKNNPNIASCRAHRRDGVACTNPPMDGGLVCRMHGGSTPAVKSKSKERAAVSKFFKQGRAGAMMAALREDIGSMHPLDGLLYAVTESAVMAQMYSGMVSELGTDVDAPPVLWGMDDTGSPVFQMPKALYGRDHTGDGAPHTLVNEYFRWMNFHVRACKTALDANIDERVVRNATIVSDQMMTVFQASVKAANLSPEQAKAFGITFAAELRKLSGSAKVNVPGKVIDS